MSESTSSVPPASSGKCSKTSVGRRQAEERVTEATNEVKQAMEDVLRLNIAMFVLTPDFSNL